MCARRSVAHARLTLTVANPDHTICLDPLAYWAKGIWDKALDDDVFACAWNHALRTVGHSNSPMRAAEGAAGAYLAVLCHHSWKAPSFKHILTDELDCDGTAILLDLNFTCPKVVLVMAARRLYDIDAANSSLVEQLGGPPELEPLRAFLKGKLSGDSPAMRSLQAMGEGGWEIP